MRLAAAATVLLLAVTPALAGSGKTGEPGDTPPASTSGTPLDPVVADALDSCRNLLPLSQSQQQSYLRDAGWAPTIESSTQSRFYAATDGAKSYFGAGDATLFATYETYPSYIAIFCQVSIEGAQRKIPFGDLETLSGLRGKVYETSEAVAGSFEEDAETPGYFLQVDQTTDGLTFNLQLTALLRSQNADF